MGLPFISFASTRTRVAWLVAGLATALGTQAQQIASFAWQKVDDTCPAFLRVATTVTTFREGEDEFVEIGGRILKVDRAATVASELAFVAGPFNAEDWAFRVQGGRCAASSTSRGASLLSPELSKAFKEKAERLRSADASVAAVAGAIEARDLPGALALSKEACDVRRLALGEAHPIVAECEVIQARRAIAVRRYDDALQLSRGASMSLERLPGGRGSLEFLGAKQVQSQALHLLSRPSEAYDAAMVAAEGRKKVLGPTHLDTLGSMGMVGISLQALGRLDEAIPLQEELVRVHTSREGAAGPETVRSKLNLSASLQQRGEYDRVVVLQREVYEARRATLGESDPATLASTHDLGIALGDAGRIDEALHIVSRALPLFLERFGEDHPQTLRIKTLLGTLYARMGRDDEALMLYSDVYASRRRTFGDAHASTISAAYNVGTQLLLLDRPSEAAAIAGVAIAKMPEVQNRVAQAELGLIVVQAESQLRLRMPQDAVETLRAQRGREPLTVDAVRHMTLRQLEITSIWSRAQLALGNMSEGIGSMDALYRGCRERFGPDHPLTLEAMATLAGMHESSGSSEDARHVLSEFVDINERLVREGIATSAANRGRLVQGVRDRPYTAGYRTYVRLLATQDPVRALEIAELTKARSLAETLARPQADNPVVKAARIQFARADERVAEVDIGSAPYMKAVADRTKAEEDLRKAIGPTMRRPALDVRTTLKRVLAPGTAFVDFIVSGDRVVAITSNNQAKVTARDLGTIAGLADIVEAFRRATTSPDPASERMWIHPDGSVRWSLSQPQGATRLTDLDAIGKKLSARLLDPLAPDIGNAKTWIISPDGPLAFLPFEALRIGKQLVLETKNVVYTPSLSSLAIMPARVTTGPRWDFLGIGVSNFGKSSKWRDLPEAEAEVNAIGELFPVSRVLAGPQATEERLRTLDTSGELRRYRYVHFATHAFLSDRGTSLSGVVLAGAGATAGDGIVTAAEWPTYRLDSDLVVLSACDTGLGRLVAGEGVVGLPSALLTAGTRAVVLTLWSVADSSAAEFMPRFYKRLRSGRAPAEALRETKLELARSKGPWSSPRHWAPYVLYGAP